MAKKKLNILSIILLAVSLVGVILAVVGIAIPWFVSEGTLLGNSSSTNYNLFAEFKGEPDFPIAAVQAFAIITLILAVLACIVLTLNSLGIVKVKWLYRVICAALVVVCAILTLVFAIVFADKYFNNVSNALGSASFNASAGSYLLPIGAIVASVPLVIGRK